MISLGQAQVSLELRDVFKNGVPLRIGTRAFDILEILIRCTGRLVSKDEILQRVWPDTVVEENNLQVHISALRKVLGSDRDLIRTIPGRGYMLIGSDDESLPVVVAEPALVCAQLRKTELPHHVALIGRDGVLEDACQALLSTSLLTLTGPGGIGKTSLAIAVAHRLAVDGGLAVCFVPLAQITCPELILEALACALDVEPVVGQVLFELLVERFNQQPRLVILDNCEHVIEAAATMSEQLVQRCPSLRILVTSREPLRIAHERSLNVAPLVVPLMGVEREQVLGSSAAQLFLVRLQALDSSFPVDDAAALDAQSVELIGTICRLLDGVPLALEMAAARAATLGLFELVASLREGPHLLSGSLRSAPLRHQTLEASVQWSYRLLEADERIVLSRIGRFAGRFTLEQACEVAQGVDIPKARVMDCMIGLALKSLLTVTAEGPFRFYRLLGATRTWVVARLTECAAEVRRDDGHVQGASLASLRAASMQQDGDHFHTNHQRVLAVSR